MATRMGVFIFSYAPIDILPGSNFPLRPSDCNGPDQTEERMTTTPLGPVVGRAMLRELLLQSAPGTLNRSKETGTIKTFPLCCQFQFADFGSAFEASSAGPGKRKVQYAP